MSSCFQKQNKTDVISFFKNSSFFNYKLINKTKKKVLTSVLNTLKQMCSKELEIIFQEYLQKNDFKQSEAEMFIKSFDLSNERNSNN